MSEDDEDRGHRARPHAGTDLDDAAREVTEIGYGRTLALSDGVFAIAMTLLALDLVLPGLAHNQDGDVTNRALIDGLVDTLPKAGIYLLSFWIVAQYWIAHRRLYGMVARIDRRMTVLNLLMLALVAAMPFPSSVMGEHGNLPAAVTLYAGYLSLTSLLVGAQWCYAGWAGLFRPAATVERRRREVFNSVMTPVVLLLAVPLSFPFGAKAAFVWLLLLLTDGASAALRRRRPG